MFKVQRERHRENWAPSIPVIVTDSADPNERLTRALAEKALRPREASRRFAERGLGQANKVVWGIVVGHPLGWIAGGLAVSVGMSVPEMQVLSKTGVMGGGTRGVRAIAKRTSGTFKLGPYTYWPRDMKFYEQRLEYTNHFARRFRHLVDELPRDDERRLLLTVDADRDALTPEQAAHRDIQAAQTARQLIATSPDLDEDIEKALRLQAEWALLPRWSRRLKLKDRLKVLAVKPPEAVTDEVEPSPRIREPFSELSYDDRQARELEIQGAASVLRGELEADLVARSRVRGAFIPPATTP